ncbi:uncharacterized protein LOC131648707 [Vicia villosa]|uniref:uncharacterized protein LOC131648707 n=1 Tax=Vicia villosa TaxID=3911 RepID=UPI00273B8A38|nr:uncharacterized protein LOC131648707 [Vicia villosa]
MSSSALDRFVVRYGDILDLLRDFQLAPTLEEMDAMLGFSRTKKEFYTGIGKEVEISDLAKALGVPATDLESNYKNDGDVHGIKRSYLESQAMCYAQKKQWDICGHLRTFFGSFNFWCCFIT